MPFAINRYPRGLLALLGSKVGGVTPPAFGDQVAPVLELSQFYLADTTERSTVSGNLAATGLFASTIVVPDTELWYIQRYSVISGAALGAGQSLTMVASLTYSLAGATRAQQLGPVSNAGGVGNFVSCKADQPFLAYPAQTLGCIVLVLAAGPVNGVLFSVEFSRLQI